MPPPAPKGGGKRKQDKMESKLKCFRCGQMGHKIADCPQSESKYKKKHH